MNSETSIFDNPSVTFGHLARKMIPPNDPKRFFQLKKSPPVQTKHLLCPKALGQGPSPKIIQGSEVASRLDETPICVCQSLGAGRSSESN